MVTHKYYRLSLAVESPMRSLSPNLVGDGSQHSRKILTIIIIVK